MGEKSKGLAGGIFKGKIDAEIDALKPKIAGDIVKPENKVEESASIFGGKSEVSKLKLEHEMKTNPKAWQAAREAGLGLSPVERASLVKEVFSPAFYGSDISKSDLKLGIKKLNQKLSGAKSPQEHAKIRKEIKFFKKIGDIK